MMPYFDILALFIDTIKWLGYALIALIALIPLIEWFCEDEE